MYARWVIEDSRFAFSSEDSGGHEITTEYHQALLNGESNGQLIAPDKKGIPILVDRPPTTTGALIAHAKQWRDAEIDSVRWMRERHRDEVDSKRATTLTVKQSGELLEYVQALRDWPKAPQFPAEVTRPTRPIWIKPVN